MQDSCKEKTYLLFMTLNILHLTGIRHTKSAFYIIDKKSEQQILCHYLPVLLI